MDPQSTLTDVRRLITEAKNEQAAERLLTYLNTADEPQRSWRDTVSNLLAQYKRLRQQQERGIVSFDDSRLAINQITDGLLAALAGIEEGETAPEEKAETAAAPKTPWLAIGVIVALVLAGASFLMLRNMFRGDTPNGDEDAEGQVTVEEVEQGKCPTYDEASEFNILVLPFLALDNKPARVEKSVQIDLGQTLDDYGIYGSVFLQNMDPNSNDYPVTNRQATSLARPCDAQLIIWGTTEQIMEDGKPQTLTTTKFQFVESEHFSLANLELTSNVEVDTVSSLSSIATNGELTEELKMSLRLIFGLIAHETDNHALAAELLDDVITERGGVEAVPKWGLIQADSYIRLGQEEKAIRIYEQVLRKDSTNVQAWVQKGLLEYSTGQTMAAHKDFDRALEQDPNNQTALTARAAISVQRNDLYQADQDLNQLDKMQATTPASERIRENYRSKQADEKQKMEEADERIQQNPNDTAAWRIKAEAAQHLGDFRSAETAANQLLNIDPKSVPALTTLQAITEFLPDSVQIKQRIQQTLPTLSPQQLRNFRVKGGQ